MSWLEEGAVTTPLLLVLGGARSGKSAYAEERMSRLHPGGGGSVLYVATMLPGDPGSEARIRTHRERRPRSWRTVEVDGRGDAAAALGEERALGVVLDGFELALSLRRPATDEAAESFALDTALAVRRAAGLLGCIVSTEVGLGVHPETPAGIEFRDRLGAANQALARVADEVVLVVAGLPLPLHGPGDEGP